MAQDKKEYPLDTLLDGLTNEGFENDRNGTGTPIADQVKSFAAGFADWVNSDHPREFFKSKIVPKGKDFKLTEIEKAVEVQAAQVRDMARAIGIDGKYAVEVETHTESCIPHFTVEPPVNLKHLLQTAEEVPWAERFFATEHLFDWLLKLKRYDEVCVILQAEGWMDANGNILEKKKEA